MTYYECAMMEVETKFRVLDAEFGLQHDRNPIESIKSRLKSTDSLAKKLVRKGFPVSVDSIEKNIYDVAGVRVVCTFPEDMFSLAESWPPRMTCDLSSGATMWPPRNRAGTALSQHRRRGAHLPGRGTASASGGSRGDISVDELRPRWSTSCAIRRTSPRRMPPPWPRSWPIWPTPPLSWIAACRPCATTWTTGKNRARRR